MQKNILFAVLLAIALVAACAPATKVTPTATRSEVLYREAVVETVDKETRQILLTGENGRRLSFVAGPDVRNFEQIEPGDRVRLGYYQGVAARMADPDDPGGAVIVSEADRAALGERPALAAATVTNLVVEFISYDATSAVATFVTPDGIVHSTKLHPDMRSFAAARKAGDRIEVTIEQAVAVSVDEL